MWDRFTRQLSDAADTVQNLKAQVDALTAERADHIVEIARGGEKRRGGEEKRRRGEGEKRREPTTLWRLRGELATNRPALVSSGLGGVSLVAADLLVFLCCFVVSLRRQKLFSSDCESAFADGRCWNDRLNKSNSVAPLRAELRDTRCDVPLTPWEPSGATISNSIALDHPALIVLFSPVPYGTCGAMGGGVVFDVGAACLCC